MRKVNSNPNKFDLIIKINYYYSRAIMKYLVDQYAKDDTLAPKEPKLAAMVNQRLFFDVGTLFSRLQDYFVNFL